MNDLISRQAALDALDKVAEMFPYRIPGKAKTYRQYNEAWSDAIDAAENALEALPSAQPDTCDGCKWEGAFGYGECQHCKRAFDDMFEEGESV